MPENNPQHLELQTNGDLRLMRMPGSLNILDELGRLTPDTGPFDIRVSAKQITGDERLRLCSIVLMPVREREASMSLHFDHTRSTWK